MRSFVLSLVLLLGSLSAARAEVASPPAAAPAPAPAATAEVAPSVAAPSGDADQEARTSFEAGKAAYDRGDYAAALVQFEHAYDLSHRSLLLYNLGLAHDRLQHEARALESYEAYLAANPNDERAPDARARAKLLRDTIDARRSAASAPRDGAARDSTPDPQRRRRRMWIGIAAGVLAVGAGVTAALVAGRDDDKPASREPNSGVHIEALSW